MRNTSRPSPTGTHVHSRLRYNPHPRARLGGQSRLRPNKLKHETPPSGEATVWVLASLAFLFSRVGASRPVPGRAVGCGCSSSWGPAGRSAESHAGAEDLRARR